MFFIDVSMYMLLHISIILFNFDHNIKAQSNEVGVVDHNIKAQSNEVGVVDHNIKAQSNEVGVVDHKSQIQVMAKNIPDNMM